jgi:ribosome-associated protein
VLCSGESDRQVRAIADHIDGVLSGQRHPPLSIEGLSTSQWILMDFGDVVAHVFRSDIRRHYGLERLWSDAKRVRPPETAAAAAGPALAPPRKRRSRTVRQG